MSDNLTRLSEVCREESLGFELVDPGQSLEQVFDRALAECAREVELALGGSDEALCRAKGLMRLALQARSLQLAAASAGSLDVERQISQVEGRLDEAQVRAEQLKRQLDATVRDLGGHVGDGPLLGDLFNDLSRLCHKINNPLTSIMGRAQMMQLRLGRDGDEKLTKSVQVIEESSKRVAGLIQELAALVGQGRKEFVQNYDSNSGSR